MKSWWGTLIRGGYSIRAKQRVHYYYNAVYNHGNPAKHIMIAVCISKTKTSPFHRNHQSPPQSATTTTINIINTTTNTTTTGMWQMINKGNKPSTYMLLCHINNNPQNTITTTTTTISDTTTTINTTNNKITNTNNLYTLCNSEE